MLLVVRKSSLQIVYRAFIIACQPLNNPAALVVVLTSRMPLPRFLQHQTGKNDCGW